MKWYVLFSLLFLFSCQEHDNRKSSVVDTSKVRPVAEPKVLPNPYAAVDVSPMDMAYFPVDFPKIKMTKEGNEMPVARVIYSRPHRQGRKIFGNVLKYGEPWRLGANEASEIEFFREVTIQNKRIKAGRYLLYCIPEPTTWTIVFNNNLYTWGLKLDAKRDLFKFSVPVQPAAVPIEFFTMIFEPTSTGADLVMTWDDVEAHLPMRFR